MRTLGGAVALVGLVLGRPATARAVGPGDFDPTFNGGSPVVLDLAQTVPRSTLFRAIVFDAGGAIVLAGDATDATGQPGVSIARLHVDGTVDASFGTGGSRVIQMGLGSGPYSFASDVAARPNGGGWLVGGSATGSDDRTAQLAAALDATGMPDIGYGSGGSVRPQAATAPGYAGAYGAAFTSDGAVLLAGTLEVDPSTGANRKLVLAKVAPTGQLDTTFGNQSGFYVGGFSQTTDTGSFGIRPLVTANGILVAGTTLDAVSRNQVLLVRFTQTGTLDTTFGGGVGYVRVQAGDPAAPASLGSGASTLAVGPSNEIYVAGYANDGDGREAIAITRFTPSGGLDGTFGSGGTRRFQAATDPSARSAPNDVAVQADGKVLVAASVNDDSNRFHTAILRLDVGGNLDPSFGTGGVVRPVVGDETYTTRIAITPGGDALVVTGRTTTGSVTSGLVARILLVPPTTTTTTLPGGCAMPPSIPGVRCRIALLAQTVGAEVTDARQHDRLAKLLAQAGDRVDGADGLKPRKRCGRLKKTASLVHRFDHKLDTHAAMHAITADVRADLHAAAMAIAGELATLIGT